MTKAQWQNVGMALFMIFVIPLIGLAKLTQYTYWMIRGSDEADS